MNDVAVGTWEVDSAGRHHLTYDPDWLESERGRPVSLSMPLLPAGVCAAVAAARLVSRSYAPLWEKSAAEQGRLQRERGPRKTGEKALKARSVAARAWRVVAQVLAKSPDPADRQLAADIVGVLRQVQGLPRGQETRSPHQDLGQAQSGPRITDQDEGSRRQVRRGPER